MLHIIIGILFIALEREALFGPPLPALDTERPVLIGNPLGTSDDHTDSEESPAGEAPQSESRYTTDSSPATDPGESAHDEETIQASPTLSQEQDEPVVELPPQSQTPRMSAPIRQLPDREARHARWRRKTPKVESRQERYPQQSPFRSDGQVLHDAFTTYRATNERARSAKDGSPTGTSSVHKKVLWGERAQKNAAQLEIDLYIRRLMRALKDRAAFYEETISVSHSVHTRVSVVMVIERSGTLRHIEVRPSTGVAEVDRAIEQFCRYATIPPLPTTFPDNELVLPIQVRIEQAAGIHRMRFTVDTP